MPISSIPSFSKMSFSLETNRAYKAFNSAVERNTQLQAPNDRIYEENLSLSWGAE